MTSPLLYNQSQQRLGENHKKLKFDERASILNQHNKFQTKQVQKSGFFTFEIQQNEVLNEQAQIFDNCYSLNNSKSLSGLGNQLTDYQTSDNLTISQRMEQISDIGYLESKCYSDISQSDISIFAQSIKNFEQKPQIFKISQIYSDFIKYNTVRSYGHIIGRVVKDYLVIQKNILEQKPLESEAKFIVNEKIQEFAKNTSTFIESFKFQQQSIYQKYALNAKFYIGELINTDTQWVNYIFKLFCEIACFIIKNILETKNFLKYLFLRLASKKALAIQIAQLIENKNFTNMDYQCIKAILQNKDKYHCFQFPDSNSVIVTYKFIDYVLRKLIDEDRLESIIIAENILKEFKINTVVNQSSILIKQLHSILPSGLFIFNPELSSFNKIEIKNFPELKQVQLKGFGKKYEPDQIVGLEDYPHIKLALNEITNQLIEFYQDHKLKKQHRYPGIIEIIFQGMRVTSQRNMFRYQLLDLMHQELSDYERYHKQTSGMQHHLQY
ncbi:UNKNOWN [Stylonychia lemnae]|uniref:Uncharacterized protein n=1 Tax=Stylonychia lemnae TaxID=5949 RepID=A0A078BBT2_STYLE|nr:UNKNOWN [Stylonychia lemnae]|eukprot:CDW91666.1 UNKNOWN [Stylonychia lemnae]